ncbi:MAG: flagellar FlbD family protein [Elusimicrobia bacterium]|nr:flagellar FlbD family protein [Elusimicrobiota bacterium]
MITVTRLNGTVFTVNAELIETVERTPDTVIALATGNRYIVQEPVEEVVSRVLEYRKKINAERPVQNPIHGFERSNP